MVSISMRNICIIFILLFSQMILAQTSETSSPENFVSFWSGRFDISGGGSQMKYQNKNTRVISVSTSKKLVNLNAKLVKITSPNFKWYMGLSVEDYSYQNINLMNEFSLSGQLGISYSWDRLILAAEIQAYQHMEMNALGEIIRKLDPALKIDWKYDLINWNKQTIGVGQSYQSTTPIEDMTTDPYNKNIYADYDVMSQVYFRKIYEKASLEFYVQHDFKVNENAYYRMESDNMLIGLRFALPFQ